MREKNMFARAGVELTNEEAVDIVSILYDGYINKPLEERIANLNDHTPENLISLYLYYIIKNNFKEIVYDFKKNYIENEALVEPGVTKEERAGLGKIYDYIGEYELKGEPDMFIETLKLHILLYSEEAHPEFGGRLRQLEVRMAGMDYEVPSVEEAKRQFNSYIGKKIKLNECEDIFDYLDKCIIANVELIKLQPFGDGNKRALRGLLNLQLACIGIPPVYIAKEERKIYKNLLIEAIITNDCTKFIKFYYYKICDAIMVSDVMKSSEIAHETESEKKHILVPNEKNS